ncbi:Hemerythrin HHE cation binding domain protein [Methanolobus psychrophilus R15]|nr:Hemerythrin HHE cation binding domain protein [Methanolobus psychrophilus R15]
MDKIYKILKQEHVKVMKLFDEAISKESKDVFMQLKSELDIHMAGEEKLYYPQLENKKEATEVTLEGYEEHHVAKLLLSEIENTPVDDKRWIAKMKVLKETVQHHVKEEESEIFEKSRKVLSDSQAEEIGSKYMEFKQEQSK